MRIISSFTWKSVLLQLINKEFYLMYAAITAVPYLNIRWQQLESISTSCPHSQQLNHTSSLQVVEIIKCYCHRICHNQGSVVAHHQNISDRKEKPLTQVEVQIGLDCKSYWSSKFCSVGGKNFLPKIYKKG